MQRLFWVSEAAPRKIHYSRIDFSHMVFANSLDSSLNMRGG